MTLVASGNTYFPQPLANSGVAVTGLSLSTISFDSATDRLAFVGRATVTDSISKIHFRTGTVTTGNTMEVRIETVTNGRPSGTLWNSPTNTTNGTVVIADSDDNVWKTVTLTAAASVTPGQEFAVVFVNSSGTPNLQIGVMPSSQVFGTGHYPALLQDTGAGTWAAVANTSDFICIVEMTTAGPVFMTGMFPINAAGTFTAFNSGSSPDEYAMKFTAPMKCRCIGARVYIGNVAAGADFTVSLWPASSSVDGDALAQTAEDGDFATGTTIDGYVDVYWATAVTFSAATVYYLGVRADTANNLAIGAVVAASGITNAIRAFGIPTDGTMFQATRTWTAGTAGAWTETATTTLPVFSLIIDQLDDGAGGGMRLAGHGGLAA